MSKRPKDAEHAYCFGMDRLSPATDDLSRLLGTLNVRSAVYCRSDLGAPWGFRVEDSQVAKFHLVLEGEAVLTLDGGEGVAQLGAGDLVLLPHGTGHAMQDRPTSRIRRLDRILAESAEDFAGTLTFGGRGPRTSVLCGGFELTSPPDELLSVLPKLLVLDADGAGTGRWVEPLFLLVRDEASRGEPGAASLFSKVADVFLTQIVRRYLADAETWTLPLRLEASGNAEIAEAVRLLLREPEAAWTVAALSHKVGMSRTAMAQRFRGLVGQPPMRYLANIRLSHGARYLTTTNKRLAEVARSVGYDNEASFSKAFKRRYGQAPGVYRAARRAAAI